MWFIYFFVNVPVTGLWVFFSLSLAASFRLNAEKNTWTSWYTPVPKHFGKIIIVFLVFRRSCWIYVILSLFTSVFTAHWLSWCSRVFFFLYRLSLPIHSIIRCCFGCFKSVRFIMANCLLLLPVFFSNLLSLSLLCHCKLLDLIFFLTTSEKKTTTSWKMGLNECLTARWIRVLCLFVGSKWPTDSTP